jgi:hypothetical protein
MGMALLEYVVTTDLGLLNEEELALLTERRHDFIDLTVL